MIDTKITNKPNGSGLDDVCAKAVIEKTLVEQVETLNNNHLTELDTIITLHDENLKDILNRLGEIVGEQPKTAGWDDRPEKNPDSKESDKITEGKIVDSLKISDEYKYAQFGILKNIEDIIAEISLFVHKI